jgi:hypothetical protein
MVGQATIDNLRQVLAKERGRDVSDAEVQEALDYLYALADLIIENWRDKQVEKKRKLTNQHYDDDNNPTGI